jgi:hypothetical protein
MIYVRNNSYVIDNLLKTGGIFHGYKSRKF